MRLSDRDVLALRRMITEQQVEESAMAIINLVVETRSDAMLTDDQRQVFENDLYPSMVEELTCWRCGWEVEMEECWDVPAPLCHSCEPVPEETSLTD